MSLEDPQPRWLLDAKNDPLYDREDNWIYPYPGAVTPREAIPFGHSGMQYVEMQYGHIHEKESAPGTYQLFQVWRNRDTFEINCFFCWSQHDRLG